MNWKPPLDLWGPGASEGEVCCGALVFTTPYGWLHIEVGGKLVDTDDFRSGLVCRLFEDFFLRFLHSVVNTESDPGRGP